MSDTAPSGLWNPTDRRTALVGALAPLTLGSGVAAVAGILLLVGGPVRGTDLAGVPHLTALVAALAGIGVLVAAAHAFAHRGPVLWMYPWLGVCFVVTVTALNLAIEDRAHAYSSAVDTVVLIMLGLATLVIVGAVVLRGWQHAGLFAAGFAAAWGLSLCFWATAGPFKYGVGLLGAPMSAVMAGLLFFYMRGTDTLRILCLVAVGTIDVGLARLVGRALSFFVDLFWPFVIVSTVPLIVGPLLGLIGTRVRRAWRQSREAGAP